MYNLKKVTYDEIYPIWKKKLWVGRHSAIEPISKMIYLGGIDNFITAEKYEPSFFAIMYKNKIIGVNSGHKTAHNFYRSRGLYVDPDFRGHGLGTKLLIATIQQAYIENCRFVWSFPRESSINTYRAAGFKQTSDYTNDGEFGPNCYVMACSYDIDFF